MDAFLVEVRQRPQLRDGATMFEHVLAVIGPIGDIGLAESGIELAGCDVGDIFDRTCRRLGERNKPRYAAAAAILAASASWRIADRTRNHPTQDEERASGLTGPNAEIADILGAAGANRQNQGSRQRA